MKLSCSLLIAGLFFFNSCKQKEKKEGEKFFPALSFIKGQIAAMDTSLYSIRKLDFIDSIQTDTTFIHRDQFRVIANDFLTVPDIASPKYEDRYKEEKLFDESLNRVMITYSPVDPEKEQVQRQQILIKPDPSGDKVTNIFIETTVNTKDSAVQKKLLWKVDESFQVTTTRQLAGQPEKTTTFKVVWGENE